MLGDNDDVHDEIITKAAFIPAACDTVGTTDPKGRPPDEVAVMAVHKMCALVVAGDPSSTAVVSIWFTRRRIIIPYDLRFAGIAAASSERPLSGANRSPADPHAVQNYRELARQQP
jgi:hypothetical protein